MTQSYIQKVCILYYDFFFLIVIAIIIASLEVTCSKKTTTACNKTSKNMCGATKEISFACLPQIGLISLIFSVYLTQVALRTLTGL